MNTRQRWLAAIIAGLFVGATGCDSGSDKGSGDGTKADAGGNGNNGGNNGGGADSSANNTGVTGNDNTKDSGDDGPPPDLNFIPANEGKCDIATNPNLRASAKEALTGIASYRAERAADLELCPTEKGDRVCAPCADNPFLTWVNAVDAADSGGTAGKENRMALAEYFRRALQYPFRELLLLQADGENAGLVLAQGKATCTEAGPCADFALQPESAEADCVTLTQNLTLSGAPTVVNDVTTTVTKESKNAFGFLVPLTPTLPTFPLANPPTIAASIPNACPTAVQVTSEQEFHSFLACNPTLKVLLTSPKLTRVEDADGATCMQLSGLVDVTSLPTAARKLVDTASYEDPDFTGFIRLNLSARLIDANVSVDSSVSGEVAP